MFDTITERLTADDTARADGGRSLSAAAGGTSSDSAGASTEHLSAVRTGGDETQRIDLDQVFGLMKNRRRREALRHMRGESGQVRLGDLAERIAADECDKSVAGLDSQERKRVYVALYQCHLPKMADADAVVYDKSRGTIERGPNFGLFEHYLPDGEDLVESSDDDPTIVQSLAALLT